MVSLIVIPSKVSRSKSKNLLLSFLLKDSKLPVVIEGHGLQMVTVILHYRYFEESNETMNYRPKKYFENNSIGTLTLTFS